MNKRALIFIILLLFVGGFLIFLRNFYKQEIETPIQEPGPIRISGEYVCLPHKNKTGPQTLECALGIKANEGNYYSLDTQSIDQDKVMSLQTGQKILVEGSFVPLVALSSDHWQIYDIEGIIRVNYLTSDF